MSQAGVAGVLEQKKKDGATRNSSSVPEKAIGTERVGNLIGDMKSELGKVTWTSRDEMQLYIKVVVAATLVFGLGIYFADLIIQGVLLGLGAIVRLIGG